MPNTRPKRQSYKPAIDLVELCERFGSEERCREYLVALRDVGRRDQRLAALLANQVRGLFELRFGPRDEPAGVALSRETLRDVASDSTPCAGYQCNFAV